MINRARALELSYRALGLYVAMLAMPEDMSLSADAMITATDRRSKVLTVARELRQAGLTRMARRAGQSGTRVELVELFDADDKDDPAIA